jgi:hypothetical protein
MLESLEYESSFHFKHLVSIDMTCLKYSSSYSARGLEHLNILESPEVYQNLDVLMGRLA